MRYLTWCLRNRSTDDMHRGITVCRLQQFHVWASPLDSFFANHYPACVLVRQKCPFKADTRFTLTLQGFTPLGPWTKRRRRICFWPRQWKQEGLPESNYVSSAISVIWPGPNAIDLYRRLVVNRAFLKTGPWASQKTLHECLGAKRTTHARREKRILLWHRYIHNSKKINLVKEIKNK